MTMLAVFRSRAQTLVFLEVLSKSGVPASAVNTPKEAGIGCGISAKFDERFFLRAQALLKRKNYSAFVGFMKGVGGQFFFVN